MMVIPSNLTINAVKFASDPNSIDFSNETIMNVTEIRLYMDLSNYQVTVSVRRRIAPTPPRLTGILQIFQELGKAFEDLCMQYLNRTLTPVKLMPPVYGTYDTKWTNFLAPGVITVIAFAQSISVTAMSFVKERTNGCMDRIYAAGVPAGVLIMANFLTHSLILVVQVTIMLLVGIFGFQIQSVGNLFYVFTLLLTLGIVGQSFGMFVSSVVREESEAIQMTLAIFFPALLLSGVIWPIEAIPYWFVWLSKGLPTTWTAAAMRSVMLRGWDITYQSVWLGYVVNAAWTVFFLFFAGLLLSSVGSYLHCMRALPFSSRLLLL